jgi:hypothetical protein
VFSQGDGEVFMGNPKKLVEGMRIPTLGCLTRSDVIRRANSHALLKHELRKKPFNYDSKLDSTLA